MDAYIFNSLLKKLKYDSNALQALYSYYFSRIIKCIQKKYGFYIAEEAAQQFFLQLLTSENEYPYIKYPTSWVYTCCENIAKRMIEKENRDLPIQENVSDKEMVSNEELFGDLYELIAQQDELAQKILNLHFIDGYNLKEIAQILNISYSNIRQKYSRTIRKMKKGL